MRRREAFTLIEMLIVITVIGILAGISFKLVRVAKRNADRAATVAKLEKVSHALNEFKAEYGMYPPVAPNACQQHTGWDCRMCYQYEDTNRQGNFTIGKLDDDPSLANLFDMGLVAFLEEREKDGIYHTENKEWVPDTDRDVLAKKRWSVFLEGVIGSGGTVSNNLTGSSTETELINSSRTIKDSWNNVIRYECEPPYLSYKLWSLGPPGGAPIHKDNWDD